MGVRLTVNDLRDLADTVEKANDAGIEILQMRVREHVVMLDRLNDGRHVVVGITDSEFPERVTRG